MNPYRDQNLMDDNIPANSRSLPSEATNLPAMLTTAPTEKVCITDIVLEYKPNNAMHHPPDDLTLVIFSPYHEMGGGLPMERTSATSWKHDGLVEMPGFGEELIMIAFWESELEDREVFYHSITGENTGLTCDFVADVDGPTLTVKFAKVRALMGLSERLDDYDQGPDETLDGCATAETTPYDPETAQLESVDDNFTGMLPLLTEVGNLFSRRFEHTGDIVELSKAISIENRLVAQTPKGDPNLPGRLADLSVLFSTLFEHTRDVSDISTCISAQEKAVDLTPEGSEEMLPLLGILSTSYMSRFSLTQDLPDASKAISALEKGVQFMSDDDENLPWWLSDLGESLMWRFEGEGDPRDISEAIRAQEKAVRLTSDGDEGLPGRLSNLGVSYMSRFKGGGGMISDISEAISLQRKAVKLTLEDQEDMPILLNCLGSSLMLRFECTGDRLDTEGATTALKRALELAPEGHALNHKLLNNLGIALWNRFTCTGDISDIYEAISAHQKALSLISASERANCLNNLGISFGLRFGQEGDLLDICEAISALQESISLTEENHPNMPNRLNNLAGALIQRFEQTGDLADMSNAISVQQRAVRLTPEDHAAMPSRLDTLGMALSSRFRSTKDLKDISESISAHERAVESTSKDNTNLPLWLGNLGYSFMHRFEQTGDFEDISKAISAHKKAIDLTSESHPHLPTALYNLGCALMTCFKSTKDKNTISEAISAQKRAIQCTPEGHGLMPQFLSGLADSFLSRFEETEESSDLEAAISNYRQSANGMSGSPYTRLDAAKSWSTWALKLNTSESDVMAAFSTAIRLASLVAGIDQTIESRHSKLFLHISDLSTRAAAAALSFGRPGIAVEWLEQGRCLVWSQINNLRTPLDELRDHHRALADRFASASRALEISGSRTQSQISDTEDNFRNRMSLQDEVEKQVKLARRWEGLLHEIRSIDGFHDFLQPQSISSLLSRVPKTGPIIIINAHVTRCDAIALLPGAETVIHIPLENLSYTEANNLNGLLHQTLKPRSLEDEQLVLRKGGPRPPKRKHLRKILLELWLNVVKPILTQLANSFPTTNSLRIWWCATGPLAFLPIHAAGNYSRDKEHSECLSDFAISSYTPTVSALIERTVKNHPTESPPCISFLLVGQPNAPAPLPPLPGTAREVEAIWKELSTHGVHAIRIENESATVVRVRDAMRIHNSIHLACHGVQDTRQPLQSGFFMSDGRLQLSDIIKAQDRPLEPSNVIKTQNTHADLAFLSACQTSTGIEDLSEEAVHLAGGMLAAGYQGVVATMWAINDEHAVSMAQDFYGNLLSRVPESGEWEGSMSASAAYALHHASESMRERLGDSEDALYAWVPYIHFGI